MYNFLVDTHTHLYAEAFERDLTDVMREAIDETNVRYFYMPNVDVESVERMAYVQNAYPKHCFSMMGLHPCSVDINFIEHLETIGGHLGQQEYAAIGEIGLDYYWDLAYVEQQKIAFSAQCEWAMGLNLPIVIHARNAKSPNVDNCIDDLISLVEQAQENGDLRGVFHCFTGTYAQAKKIIDLGFYLGIGGVLTYKHGEINQFIDRLPLDSLVLETDAPYLAPTPHRGKRNSSAYLGFIAAELARLRGEDLEEITHRTTANAFALFGLPEGL